MLPGSIPHRSALLCSALLCCALGAKWKEREREKESVFMVIFLAWPSLLSLSSNVALPLLLLHRVKETVRGREGERGREREGERGRERGRRERERKPSDLLHVWATGG